MRRLLLAFFSALSFSASAQITVTDATFPAAGNTLKYVVDNNNPVNINPATPPGGNQTWDFSTLQNSQTTQTAYLNAGAGTNAGSFPGAELVTISPTVETYFNVTANKFEALGYYGPAPLDLGLNVTATFAPAIVERRAPLNFFDISQSTSNLTLPFSVADLPDNPFQGAPFTPDSMRVRQNIQRLDVVDGWGTCQIPGATYPVLRQKRTEYMTTNVDVYVSPLGWIDISQLGGNYFAGYLGTDTTVTFHFISGTEKEEIAIATMNNSLSAVEAVQYKNTTVNPPPACSITFTNPPPWDQDTACANSTGNVHSAPGGMTAYNWSISGSGTITSAVNGSSVTVTAGNSGSYNLFVTITDANGSTSTCSDQTPFKSTPICNLTGSSTACGNSTGNVYSVNNGFFTISYYNWSISGNGTIIGSATGSSITVTAGASGSYTVSVTSMGFNYCPSFCSQTVTINSASAPTITGPTSVCSGGSVMLDAGAGYTTYAWSNGGGSGQTATFSNITSTTTYTVTVSSNSCSGTDTHMVTVNPPPTCSVGGATNVCSNSTGNVYTAPPGMSFYNWGISGDGTITSATNGSSVTVTAGNYINSYTVSVTITDANSCTSTCSKQSFIYLLTPPADITVNPNPACFGITLDLSVAAAASSTVAWTGEGITDPNGNPSTTALPASTGSKTYSVIITADNGCTNSDNVEVMVQNCNIDFSGKIIFTNNNSLGVNNATVNLTGSGTGSDVTDVNGDFSISSGVPSGNFTLTPTKTVNKLNGVTAGDVTAIQQHVGNNVPITDLYKQVAADVNKTNSINSTDASVINQALLGNPAALAQIKTSWRFVPTSHTMSSPPWGFPEKRTYTNINTSQTNQNFYGIKTGDVAVTFANPANFGAGQSLVLQEKDRLLQAGETFALEFSAGQMDDLAAFQCALRFNPAQLQFVEIQPLAGLPLTIDNFGTYNIAEGEIRLVWAQATAVAVAEAAPVFRLQFTALQSGAQLSEALQLDESELPALSYTAALAESKVELKFSELTGTPPLAGQTGVQLLQNRPNPFNGQTVIGFVLPETCEAQLRIFDVSGRLLAERKAQYPAGKNEELFEVNGAAGVLYYELTTPSGVVAKKMVVTGN